MVNPKGCRPLGRFLLIAPKESVPDPERKAALGGLICRGLVLSSRFDVYTLVSLRLYETGVLSFSRDGALRRSAASRRRSLKGLASPLDPGLCRLATTRSSKPSDRILNKECLRHHSLPGPSPSSFRPSDQIPDKECPRHSSISSALAL